MLVWILVVKGGRKLGNCGEVCGQKMGDIQRQISTQYGHDLINYEFLCVMGDFSVKWP